MRADNTSSTSQFDLLIIGAGIFGTLLALEATQRGMTVLLVEKNDFGGGTSANSLKTIHGGLRYLQGLDIRSSMISARERKAWLSMAPGLVRPLPCILPTTRSLMKSKLLVGAGAVFYNLITAGRNSNLPSAAHIPDAHLLSRAELAGKFPSLADSTVTGGACWYDAQASDTERLLLACLLAAVQGGAEVLNYHQVAGLEQHNDSFHASVTRSADQAHDQTDTTRQISARLVVDCSGAGRYLEQHCLGHATIPAEERAIYLKATNLVVKKRLSSHALGIQALDDSGMSRLLFIAPWRDQYSLIGTWYYQSQGKDDQSVTEREIHSCIDQVNSAFKEPVFSIGDVVQVHLGHLPGDPRVAANKGPDAALIKHAQLRDWGKIDADHAGLYSLQGTKYTLARRAAEDTIKLLGQKHGLALTPSISATHPLWQACPRAAEQFARLGWQPQQIDFVAEYFAVAIDKLIAVGAADKEMNAPVPGAGVCCKAVIEYCLRHESAQHLTDMLVRRLPLGNAELPARQTIDYVAETMAQHFSWTPQRRSAEIEQLERYYLKRKPVEVAL